MEEGGKQVHVAYISQRWLPVTLECWTEICLQALESRGADTYRADHTGFGCPDNTTEVISMYVYFFFSVRDILSAWGKGRHMFTHLLADMSTDAILSILLPAHNIITGPGGESQTTICLEGSRETGEVGDAWKQGEKTVM